MFLRLVDEFDVRFTYRLASDAPRAIAGTAAPFGRALRGERPEGCLSCKQPRLRRSTIVLAGTLDLARVRKLQQAFEAATGLTGS